MIIFKFIEFIDSTSLNYIMYAKYGMGSNLVCIELLSG